VGGAPTPGDVLDIAPLGDDLLIADGWMGVALAPTQCHTVTGVEAAPDFASMLDLRAFPNPASNAASIRFEMASGGRAEAVVYDLAGRRVRELAARSFEAGPQHLSWDGRDDLGRAMPAGIYLVRLTTRDAGRTGRVVLTR
jgi:hypothetical protein